MITNLIKFDRDADTRAGTAPPGRGGVRVPHVNASAARNQRPQSLHREEWKIYIKPSEKSTTHPRGGSPDVRSISTRLAARGRYRCTVTSSCTRASRTARRRAAQHAGEHAGGVRRTLPTPSARPLRLKPTAETVF